jgi:hypothetical protein
MIEVESWNWIAEFPPAFIGVGIVNRFERLTSVLWRFGGSLGIIGPSLITTGLAVGTAVSTKYPGHMNYMSMVLDSPVNSPSPRYWLVW